MVLEVGVAILRKGKTNSEIGTILGAATRTISKHLEHIFRKLGLETRTAATLAALDALAGRSPAN